MIHESTWAIVSSEYVLVFENTNIHGENYFWSLSWTMGRFSIGKDEGTRQWQRVWANAYEQTRQWQRVVQFGWSVRSDEMKHWEGNFKLLTTQGLPGIKHFNYIWWAVGTLWNENYLFLISSSVTINWLVYCWKWYIMVPSSAMFLSLLIFTRVQGPDVVPLLIFGEGVGGSM